MNRLLSSFNNNEQFHKSVINTQITQQPVHKFSEGTYGLIYRTQQSNILIKAIKFPKLPENELRNKILINRKFFQREQYLHEYIYQNDKELCCPIYKPIVFGPIMYLQLEILQGYITVSDFRKQYNKIENYQQKANKIVQLLYDRTKRLTKLNIFHGDYKANNFMINENFTDLKILDFGKSKTMQEIEKTCNYCNNKWIKWQKQQTNPYDKILTQRKLKVFQNYFYSSILQYVFDEYTTPNFYKLFEQIDNHSVGCLMLHLYFPYYVNEFDKIDSLSGRYQQFIAHWIILFGLEKFMQVIENWNLIQLKQNNYFTEYEENQSYSYSDSYDDSDSSVQAYFDYQPIYQLNKQLKFPPELSQYLKFSDNKVFVSNTIYQEIQKSIESKKFEELLYQIPEEVREIIIEYNTIDLSQI